MYFNLYDVAFVPLITGLVQVFKVAGLPKKFLPLVSLLLGIGGGVFYISPGDLKGGYYYWNCIRFICFWIIFRYEKYDGKIKRERII